MTDRFEARGGETGSGGPSGSIIEKAFARLVNQPLLACVAILVVSLSLFLPGFFALPPIDRDEARFAQATKQMVASGDYVDIRFQDKPRHKKPVGIYWLQSAFVIAGDRGTQTPIWVYRLPSLLGAVLSTLLTFAIGRLLFGPAIGLAAGLLVPAIIVLGVEARLAKTDAMLLASVLAVQYVLARLWMGLATGRAYVYGGYAALAAGLLLKGPIVLMVSGTTLAALTISRRSMVWLRPLADPVGLLLFAILAFPWYVAIWLKTGGGFFDAAVGSDMIGKVRSGQESHWAPPGAHLAAMIGAFWPLSAFVPTAYGVVRRRLQDPAILFCLAWIIPTWTIFEFVPTKLPHYVLPLYPALAILVVASVWNGSGAVFDGRLKRAFASVLFLVPLLLAIATGIVSFVLGDAVSYFGVFLCLLGAALSYLAWRGFSVDGGKVRSAALVLLASVLVMSGTLGVTAPALNQLWISGRLAQQIAAVDGCADGPVIGVGFNEPSLVFLSPRPVRFSRKDAVAQALGETNCRLLLADRRHDRFVFGTLAAGGWTALELARETGRNLNGGRILDMGVYRVSR